MNSTAKSRTQRFLSVYQDLEKVCANVDVSLLSHRMFVNNCIRMLQSGLPEEELYPKAVEAYLSQIESTRNQRGEKSRNQENYDKKTEKTHIYMKKVFE